MIVDEDNALHQSREADILINSLRLDRCPDCQRYGLQSVARSGVSTQLKCMNCGEQFSVAPPRYVTLASRVKP